MIPESVVRMAEALKVPADIFTTNLPFFMALYNWREQNGTTPRYELAEELTRQIDKLVG